jgi:hypothetical protein
MNRCFRAAATVRVEEYSMEETEWGLQRMHSSGGKHLPEGVFWMLVQPRFETLQSQTGTEKPGSRMAKLQHGGSSEHVKACIVSPGMNLVPCPTGMFCRLEQPERKGFHQYGTGRERQSDPLKFALYSSSSHVVTHVCGSWQSELGIQKAKT